jgi:DNA-binding CsgD family transcriptional regulator/PAS domain-containing protein
MGEPLLSLRTVYGWFSVLAAMTMFGTTEESPAQLVLEATVPVALVDLKSRSVLATSLPFCQLVGSPTGADLNVLVDGPERLGPLLDLLIGGTVDAYEVRRELVLPDGSRLWADNWLAACERGERGQALWVVFPVDDEAARYLIEPTPVQWPERVSALVIGAFDSEWHIRRVGVNVEAVLGYPVSEAVGLSFIGTLHPEDVPHFLDAAAHCLADQAGVGVELRIAHRSGVWCAAHVVIAPVVPGFLRFGFTIAVHNAEPAELPSRRADLERILWRIGQEVEGSGIVAGFARAPHRAALPGLEDLSGRQWEVLTQLLAGERAPTIAKILHLSQSTVRNHLSDIFAKLHVHSQEELLHAIRPEIANHPDGPDGGEDRAP